MQELIEQKINEALDVLKRFGLPEENQTRVSALTLLALCNLHPEERWENAFRQSMTLSKDIMTFVNEIYKADYKPNSRESFRKLALKPFVENNIAELNPDNPDLEQTSSKTHYGISSLALNTVRKYNSAEWNLAVDNFIRFNSELSQIKGENVLLKTINIVGFKSIVEDTISLGRVNVFIGANGSGKTNILEALAVVGAAKANDFNLEGLYSRGVRMARPDLIISSFLDSYQRSGIDINLQFGDTTEAQEYRCSLSPASQTDIFTKWIDLAEEESYPQSVLAYLDEIIQQKPGLSGQALMDELNNLIAARGGLRQTKKFDKYLTDYAIYDLNTKTLRGIASDSKKTPLGINGEGLDLLISSMTKSEKDYLKKTRLFFGWLGDIITDKDDKMKVSGLKAGKSISTLYFTDKFMQKNNNILSAENSNEGILHILFYLALIISEKTPKLFAIDNIETALNPWLCQELIGTLTELAKKRGKQILITTHNPAILDGLNLLDDEQRLFEVFRDDDGHTKTRRIKFKSDLSDKKYKLSEMWMSGILGAVPRNF